MITKRQIKKRKDVKNKTLHHKKLMKEANTQTGMMIRQEKKQQKFNLNEKEKKNTQDQYKHAL